MHGGADIELHERKHEGGGSPPPAAVEHHDEDALEEKKEKEVYDAALEALLTTNPAQGLSPGEVAERLAQFGFNEISETKTNPLKKFFMYFWGPIPWLIEVAVILSGVIKDWTDLAIISALLFINAFIGFIEESKAESALDALKQTLALKSRVIRGGNIVEIESRELVPGDIVVIRLGDIVPADCRLLGIGASGEAAGELQVDQAALTGESLPVPKRRGDLCYSSSIVKQGQQLGVVAKTGERTFVGRAANLIAITNEQGHFQKIVNRLGNFLIGITLFLVLILLIILLVNQKLGALEAVTEILILTIAAIPVGLPTVLSVTMAVGAKQLAGKQVIVKRLPAVEEMAGITVLCSDKTGTLTLNQLTLVEPYLKSPNTNRELLFNAFLASEAGANDAIELAVRNGAISAIPDLVGTELAATNPPGHKVVAFKPFDPKTKLTQSTVVRLEDSAQFQVAKGAPQVIIRLAGGDAEANAAVIAYAKRGLRCLGVARTLPEDPERWELIGLLAFLDPPRPDSASTIRETNRLGVSVKMITGDQLVIAKEVAHRLGLPKTILPAEKLTEKGVSDADLSLRCLHADGFAQVIPEDKFRVVELLQSRKLLVGMTGDGVNDAPALKKANVGIAVHGCTDAARSAADVVLLSPGLSTIVDGIKTSRAIFQRMRSYALYRITSTIHFLIFFFLTISILQFSLPAKLIVLICVLNDAATLVISVDNAQISKKPDKWRLGQLITLSVILALLLSASSFAHYFIATEVFGFTKSTAQTVIYLQVSSCPHFMIFGTRVSRPFWTNPPSLIFFIAVFGTQVFAMFISIYGLLSDPIGWSWGITIMCISIGYFVMMDLVKSYIYRVWSYELTAILVPTPKRRAKLAAQKADKARKERIRINVAKAKKAVVMAMVLYRWRTFGGHKPDHKAIMYGEGSSSHPHRHSATLPPAHEIH